MTAFDRIAQKCGWYLGNRSFASFFVCALISGCVPLYGLLVPSAGAQAVPTSQPPAAVPVLKLKARQVLVDVVVTGKHGKPVTGLHKEDFEIFEDANAQAITSFEEHTGTPSASEDSADAKAEANTFTNVVAVSSNTSPIIFLLDSLNTPPADQSRVQKALQQYLQKVPAGRQVALFTLGSELHCIQGITGDATILTALAKDVQSRVPVQGSPLLASKTQEVADKTTLAMLASAHLGTAGMDAFQKTQASLLGSDRMLTTLDAFRQLANYLSGIPGRKSVAWFSSSFPHLHFSASESLEPFASQRDYSEQALATETALVSARVAIYPIAAGGLDTESFYESDTQLTSHKPMDAQQETHDSLAADGKVHNDNQASMDGIAQATGGRAIYNTNDLEGALRLVSDESAGYYTLFFKPSSTAPATEYRKIVVKVAGGHYKLTYNHGYYAKETLVAVHAATKAEDDPLGPYLRPCVMDSTQIPLDLRVTAVAASDHKVVLQGNGRPGAGCSSDNQTLVQPVTCYTVRFNIKARQLQFQDAADGSHQDALLLELLVADKNGKTLNGITSKVILKLDEARYDYVLAHGTHLEFEIGVPKDAVSLRGGVYDRNSGDAGTLQVPLAYVASEPAVSASDVISPVSENSPARTMPAAAVSPGSASDTQSVPTKQVQSGDPLSEAAEISAREDAVTIPLPRLGSAAAVEAPVPAIRNASATFWTLSSDEVQRMLASSPDETAERYSRLRAYFVKYGCNGNHLSTDRTQMQPEQNLVCLLPGSDTRTIVVTAHYERRTTDASDTQNWSSAIMLVRLYKALQAQQRHYSYVFVALRDEAGEKQFVNSLASADVRSLVAVVALDLRAPGALHYQLSQAESQGISGLATGDQVLRSTAIRAGEQTKAMLAATLVKSAQVNKVPQPVELGATREVLNTLMFHRETYIPSMLIYSRGAAHESDRHGAPEALFNLLATFLCGLDVNLASR